MTLRAYIRGYAQQDEFGCFTGLIYNIWGAGGGNIYSPASGTIHVNNPPRVAYGYAETRVIGEAYIDGVLVEYGRAVARIWVPVGAC